MSVHAKCVTALVTAFVAAAAALGFAAAGEAPPRERVSAAITNYSRLSPQIATAGVLRAGGVAEAKGLGFVAVLDLRGPQEGTEIERRDVEAAGLKYFNIPVTTASPTDPQLAEFARLVEDAANYPLLVHCATANRVGAMWTLYRTKRGVPFATAAEEGRAIGMGTVRENAVRAIIGQPQLSPR